MVSTHCHFLQKAAWGRARASSYCTYSFFIVARYAIPVARYAIPVARDANRVARDAISVSREGGNLLLSGTVDTTLFTAFNTQLIGKNRVSHGKNSNCWQHPSLH